MSTLMRFVGGSLLVLVLAGTAFAQENHEPINNPQESVPAAPLVKATATAKRVRFVSPGKVVQLRLEVYNEVGQKLFDTELRGNVLDWHLQDGAGQDLQAGSYACVLTIKSLSGRLSQRVGLVTVNDKKAAIEAAEGAQLSLAQQQTIGPVEGNATLTIRQESEGEAITAVTHDGTEGQLTSTKGALTFRTGDIFSGKDKEQMRLTEDGRLGIGTSEPQAKLDVAGTISAQRFVMAKPKVDGADKTGILSADTPATDSVEVQPLIAGTGTQDRIAKWVDNAGTLGDSVIAESAGNIGIGTTSPTHKLDVQNPGANGAIRSVNETFGVRGLISEQHSSNVVGAIFVGLKSRGTLAAPTAVVPNDFGAFFSNKWYDGTSYVQSGAFGFTVDGPVSQGVVPTRLSFITSSTSGDGSTAHGVERMTILSGGNVGIGTTAPAARLHLTGTTSSAATPLAVFSSTGSQAPLSLRTGAGGTERARISAGSDNNLKIVTTQASSSIHFDTGNNDDSGTGLFGADLFINSAGNVGFGTNAPSHPVTVGGSDTPVVTSAKVAIYGSGSAYSIVRDTTNNVEALFGADGGGALYGSMTNHDIQLRTNNSTRMRLFKDGGANITGGTVEVGTAGFDFSSLVVNGSIFVGVLGDEGEVSLCAGPIVVVRKLSRCSSSIRYKTDVRDFTPGLALLSRLRPVSFRWKKSGNADLGFVAEEVVEAEPLLTTRNERGEVEGVKYDRLTAVLVNAVREQQAQIKTQEQQLRAKDERIANLAARLARYESNLARYESRLASLERSVARGKRTKRQVTARANSTRKRGLHRAAPSKAD